MAATSARRRHLRACPGPYPRSRGRPTPPPWADPLGAVERGEPFVNCFHGDDTSGHGSKIRSSDGHRCLARANSLFTGVKTEADRPASGDPVPEGQFPEARAAQENTPWAMVDVAASARRVNTVRWASPMPGSSGAANRASSTRCPASRKLRRGLTRGAGAGPADQAEGPVGQRAGSAGQIGHFEGDRPLGSRFERGRIAVPPTAVEAPDVAHDEFGFVVDGLR